MTPSAFRTRSKASTRHHARRLSGSKASNRMNKTRTFRCRACGAAFELLDVAQVTHGRCLPCQVKWRSAQKPESRASHELAEAHRQRVTHLKRRLAAARAG